LRIACHRTNATLSLAQSIYTQHASRAYPALSVKARHPHNDSTLETATAGWLVVRATHNSTMMSSIMKSAYLGLLASAASLMCCTMAYAQNAPADQSTATQVDRSNVQLTTPHSSGQDKGSGNDMAGADQNPAGTSSQPTTGQNKATGNDMVGDSTRAAFKNLDTKNSGYVTGQDVKSNKWLSKNFAGCDSDYDGHLSQKKCAN
jgi:hypothetical protein